MNRKVFLICGAIFMSALVARGATDAAKLDVAVSYTGSGAVDESHKVYVVLWDSPDFMQGGSGSAPVGVQGVSSKSDVAHFENLPKGPVYASMVYDPSGKWDAASPPPSGSSLGLYSKEPGMPTAIELDSAKTAKVSASFDDSAKMP